LINIVLHGSRAFRATSDASNLVDPKKR